MTIANDAAEMTFLAGQFATGIASMRRVIANADASKRLDVLRIAGRELVSYSRQANFEKPDVVDMLHSAAEESGLRSEIGDEVLTDEIGALLHGYDNPSAAFADQPVAPVKWVAHDGTPSGDGTSTYTGRYGMNYPHAVEDNYEPGSILMAEADAAELRSSLGAVRSPIQATPFLWRDPKAIPPRAKLYGSHFVRGFTSATVAPGGGGKTSLLIAETLKMVSGRSIFRMSQPRLPLRVWLLNLEDPLDELDRRISAACLHYGLGKQDVEGRLFVDSGRDQSFVIAERTRSGAVIIEPVVNDIVQQIAQNLVDVLIVDPFVSCHRVLENDNSAIDMVAKKWAEIADRGNCAVELAHHTRKLGDGEATAESTRGGKALVDACRSVRVINPMRENEAENAGVENRRLYFRLGTDKANLAPPSDKAEWFHLASVDLENGPPGHSGYVAVVETWDWPDAFAGVTADDLLRVQKRIANGEWRHSSQADDWAGRAVAEVLNLDVLQPHDKSKVAHMLKTWIASGALRVVSRADEHRKERKFIEVGQWNT